MKNILFKFLFVFILSGTFYVSAKDWGYDLSGECPSCPDATPAQQSESALEEQAEDWLCVNTGRYVKKSYYDNNIELCLGSSATGQAETQPDTRTVSGTVAQPVWVIQTYGYNNYTRGVSVQPTYYQPTVWGAATNKPQTYVQPTVTQPATTTQAAPINGECGQSNGKTLSSPPTNACASGIFSSPSGVGPWYWLCAGVSGGVTVSCSAHKAQPTPTPAPTYATPTAVYSPVTNNTPNTTYQNTVWGSVTNRAQTYDPAPMYNQAVVNQPVSTYQLTNWGSNTSNSNAHNYEYKPSVTTTSATDIDQTSGVCNGLAAYAPRASYNGYFEYGSSQSLGQYTRQVNVSEGGRFSRGITGLKPGTRYYCRAVIVGTEGIYKGGLQSFTTLKDTVKYTPKVSQVINKTKVIASTTKSIAVKKIATSTVQTAKNTIICADSTGNTAELKEGEKFVSLEIVNTKQPQVGGEAEYKVLYHNKSTINLSNVYLKFSIPQEYEYVGAVGQVEGGDVLIKKSNLSPGEKGEYTISFKVKSGVREKSNAVVSSYVYYEMLTEDGGTVSDDNTAHLVSTVVEGDGSTFTFDINPLSSGSALLKWLIALGLIMLLFILGKKIRDEYQGRKYRDKVLGAHH